MSGFVANVAYEASAGSGKTFMLVVRYLSLLFMGADPSKILTLTFTNKAAAEMSERITQTLQELEDRGELAEIVKVTGQSKEELLAQRHKVLANFLNAQTKIMTIDSFFTKILRKFSLYAGLMPDFTTASAQHEIKLLKRFLNEVDAANKKTTLIDLALESKKRLLSLFALLNELYEKQEELEHLRFSKKFDRSYEDEALEALKALQEIVASCESASATLQKSVNIADFETLLKSTWVYKESLNYWVFKKCYTLEMDRHLHTIQEAIKEHFRQREQNFFADLFSLVALYKKAKRNLYKEDGELSFSDVTLLVYEILHNFETSEFLYFRLDATIEHILLDEFQDTSTLQYKILKPLIDEITSGEGIFAQSSFFFVGDVKQSIYRFRGGVSALFAYVAQEQGTFVDKLRTNYRSLPAVVEFVNETFEKVMPHYTPQLTREGVSGGYVEVLNNDELLEEVRAQVTGLLSLGAKSDDIAILCSTNADGQEIKQCLEGAGIEVVTETTTKLIEQNDVKAVLEYLKYLYFQQEIYKENFFSLIKQPSRSIRTIDLTQYDLLSIVKRCIDEYRLFDAKHTNLLKFLEIVRTFRDIDALIFEYERIDAAASSSEIRGVRVLTIHKSKGLEYPNVIVVDRLKKAPPSRDAIIYEYDGISLQNLYLRIKERDKLDEQYAKALQKEKKLSLEDRLNGLYVAFTRARDNLIVVQKTKDSLFEPLGLQESTRGAITIEQQPQNTPQPLQSVEYKELYYGAQSELLASPKISEDELGAIDFGLATHYLLEMLDSFTPQAIEDAYIASYNKYALRVGEMQMQEIHKRVHKLVNNTSFLALIEGGVCYKEKGFKIGKQLRFVDLLIEKGDELIVIDYKTGKNYESEYQKQVAFYMKSVEQLSGKKVRGYLCYLLESGVELCEVKG